MSDDNEIVQYFVVRNDLGMSPGKVAAQVGHGVELAGIYANRLLEHLTENPPCAKIVLQGNKQDFDKIEKEFDGWFYIKVIDEGRTEIEPGQATVIAFLQKPKYVLKQRLSHLKLYK